MTTQAEETKAAEFGQARLRNTLAFEYSVPHLLAAYDAAWARVRPDYSELTEAHSLYVETLGELVEELRARNEHVGTAAAG